MVQGRGKVVITFKIFSATFFIFQNSNQYNNNSDNTGNGEGNQGGSGGSGGSNLGSLVASILGPLSSSSSGVIFFVLGFAFTFFF